MAKRIKLKNKNGDIIETWDDQAQSLKEAGWSEPTEKKPQPKPIKENKGE